MKGIWTESETCGFAEFKQSFNYAGGGAVVRISAAFRYAAFINGVFVSNGQYADIPEKKRIDEIDVSSFVRKGENELYIVAMHTLEDFSIARAMDAYLVFEVLSRGVVLAESSENTLGRVPKIRPGPCPGSRPKENTAGKMAIPAIRAINVSSPATLRQLLGIFSFSLR